MRKNSEMSRYGSSEAKNSSRPLSCIVALGFGLVSCLYFVTLVFTIINSVFVDCRKVDLTYVCDLTAPTRCQATFISICLYSFCGMVLFLFLCFLASSQCLKPSKKQHSDQPRIPEQYFRERRTSIICARKGETDETNTQSAENSKQSSSESPIEASSHKALAADKVDTVISFEAETINFETNENRKNRGYLPLMSPLTIFPSKKTLSCCTGQGLHIGGCSDKVFPRGCTQFFAVGAKCCMLPWFILLIISSIFTFQIPLRNSFEETKKLCNVSLSEPLSIPFNPIAIPLAWAAVLLIWFLGFLFLIDSITKTVSRKKSSRNRSSDQN